MIAELSARHALPRGLPPDSDYRFKHALIQDAAYENLLKSRRQVLHRRVAEILRDRFPDTADAEPEVLAHHFTQAALTDAIEWWGKAGDQALRRSAFQEAISHLDKAIEMADKTGEGTSTAATASVSANRRLKIQTDLGKAATRPPSKPTLSRVFNRLAEPPRGPVKPSAHFRSRFGEAPAPYASSALCPSKHGTPRHTIRRWCDLPARP
jgi:hypothetical protein